MEKTTVDYCPVCDEELGSYCFDREITAGAEIICRECKAPLIVGEYHNGSQSFFLFTVHDDTSFN